MKSLRLITTTTIKGHTIKDHWNTHSFKSQQFRNKFSKNVLLQLEQFKLTVLSICKTALQTQVGWISNFTEFDPLMYGL